jgi:hypothetical protein
VTGHDLQSAAAHACANRGRSGYESVATVERWRRKRYAVRLMRAPTKPAMVGIFPMNAFCVFIALAPFVDRLVA